MSTHSLRTAKAWWVRPFWSDAADIFYASTASKARYSCLLAVSDCYPDLKFKHLLVHRASEHDITLPEPHWIVAELSPEERDIIMHAFGSGRDASKAGYRDHYCTAPGDGRLLRLAWELGLFRGPYGERAYADTGIWVGAFFYLTELGKHVARSMLPTYPHEQDGGGNG
jgi:hypothetical protein